MLCELIMLNKNNNPLLHVHGLELLGLKHIRRQLILALAVIHEFIFLGRPVTIER